MSSWTVIARQARSLPSSLLAQRAQRAGVDRIPAVTAFVEHAVGRQESLVSVILPTRNRADILPRAIASVIAQRHQGWELLVVDDGSDDRTPAVLDGYRDERVRRLRLPGQGLAAARNRGLSEARGDVVAYLDDDNVMHPLWLHAVAWAFGSSPEADTLYGARVIDGGQELEGMRRHGQPQVHFLLYNRRRLEARNFIDINAFAHRRALDGVSFDESLAMCEDWELILRLTRLKPPLALPVVACFYETSRSDRLSTLPGFSEEGRRVAAAVRRHRGRQQRQRLRKLLRGGGGC